MRSSLFLILLSIYTFLFFFLLHVSWLFSLLIHFTPINPNIEFDKKKEFPNKYICSYTVLFFFFFLFLLRLLFWLSYLSIICRFLYHPSLTINSLSLSLSPPLSPIGEVSTPSSHHTRLCSLSVNLDPFVSRQSKCFLNSDLMSATSLLGEIPAPPVIYPFFVFFLICSCLFYFFCALVRFYLLKSS